MIQKISFLGIILVCLSMLLQGQDTFSIVAVDSVTGEIGSAGASCVGYSSGYPHGAIVLSDVIPGIGAIHTQAAYLSANQDYAHDLMMQGLSPQQIIDSVVANDAQNNPKTRQYGIVDYNNGHPRSAGYTGINCSNYKNDTNNIYYSIQGNILLGQLVIDSMQVRFLNTSGTLADRLMAALQGAKMIGADTRCAAHNSSSLSSFIRVARPADPYDSLYLDLYMAYNQNFSGFVPVDPIDSLQTLYDLWKTTTSLVKKKSGFPVKIWSVPGGELFFDFSRCPDYSGMEIIIYDLTGKKLFQTQVTRRTMNIHPYLTSYSGISFYQVMNKDQVVLARGKILVK
jgi:uncharacterized Ntn-hydrolase superfamily protein